ncbi:MAG: SagB family peptide dehydrogenase [Xanthobacteraceae bacterium]|nr:SagB family peptide dehydrogenase [Xanthobacteraceae bacterium]
MKKRRRAPRSAISARLSGHVTLETQPGGRVFARFGQYSVDLGAFHAAVVDRAQKLRAGLPFAAFSSGGRTTDKEIDRIVRRLARHGLLEYRIALPGSDADQVVVEPQVGDYWPVTPPLGNADVLVLSRFAYMRRRGNELVLESPRAGALFRICEPAIATTIATLSTPRQLRQLRRDDGFPGDELLALLVDCQILFRIKTPGSNSLRPAEGDRSLVLWDFHDLLFHTRSTEGRHANPLGGLYLHSGMMPSPPAVRPRWPGKKIDLRKSAGGHSQAISPVASLLRERHSTRSFDPQKPITLAELSRFLDSTARVLPSTKDGNRLGGAGQPEAYAARPYPSAGASYELELYLAVDRCEGLARGFYHYDAGGHALMPIGARMHEFEALLMGAQMAMDTPAVPQILMTIAARFGRVSWKYSSLAYALILKDVGVLTQTFYLIATEMGLGGCAIGSTNIDLFAKMTGIDFHVEGAVGQFALGRGTTSEAAD